MITKLFVSGGNPLHASCGEAFPPVHPKLLNTVVIGSVPPAWNVVLVTAIRFALVGCCGATGKTCCAASVVAQGIAPSAMHHASRFMPDKLVASGRDVMWVSENFSPLSGFRFHDDTIVMRYSLAVIVALAATSGVALAQDVPNRADAVEVRKQFVNDLDTLYTKFTALANAFPAEKYSWRPSPGVRSVGEVFMHVASEFYVWSPISFGAKASPVIGGTGDAVMKQFEAKSTKADVLKALKDGFAYTQSSINGLDPNALVGTRKLYNGQFTGTIIEASYGMDGDLHEHLGQLIAYARMNGIAPPWSK